MLGRGDCGASAPAPSAEPPGSETTQEDRSGRNGGGGASGEVSCFLWTGLLILDYGNAVRERTSLWHGFTGRW
jgi:hypothetical protein